MKVIIQRVRQASVTVDGLVISEIGRGLCVLVGIKANDTLADMEYIVKKILNLKLFDDEKGKRWAASVMDKRYEVLCVSQFTLYHVMKGNKLDFHRAMSAAHAEPFYKNFIGELGKAYESELIKDGQFGALMTVRIENDGPVTIEIESPSPKEIPGLVPE